ncbi:MAG: DUF2490 domain-containing protein, partial [Cytophagales bacterium]
MRIIFLFFTILTFSAIAQLRTTNENTQAWAQYFINIKLKNNWLLMGDIGYRTQGNFIDQKFQFLTRIGVGKQFSNNLQLAGGYCYFISFQENGIERPEHRFWQQLLTTQNFAKTRIVHRYRLEQRFNRKTSATNLEDGYNFNWRARYQLALTTPIYKQLGEANAISFFAQDEIFLNFGSAIKTNYFDQNRIFVGFGYQFTPALLVNSGYQYTFLQR